MANCRDYCRFAQACTLTGEENLDPEECPRAWRIEEFVNDMRNEWPRCKDDEEPLPFDEEPEEGEYDAES